MFKSTEKLFIGILILMAAFSLTACALTPGAASYADPPQTQPDNLPAEEAALERVVESVASSATQPEATTPEEVILAFYNEYLAYSADNCCEPGTYRSPLTDRIYQDSPYLTEDLKTTIDQNLESMGPVSYDPILCAQNMPEWVQAWDVSVDGDMASATVETSLFEGDGRLHAFPVTLRHSQAGWQIAEINCLNEPEEGERPDEPVKDPDWQIYTDAEYGFSFHVPAGWTVQEAQIEGADAPVLKVITLTPDNFSGSIPPLSVEVSPSQSEQIEATSTLEMAGLVVSVMEVPNGEVFYLVDWPSGIRIAVRDSSLLTAGDDADLASAWQPFAEGIMWGIATSFD